MDDKEKNRQVLRAAWNALKRRCNDPANPDYHRYGGRGITVCERWQASFENFAEDMGPRPGKGYSLDRRNNDGPYSPENCRWATHLEQAWSRSNTRVVEIDGVTDSLAGWARRSGTSLDSLLYRMEKFNLTAQQALSLPPATRLTRHSIPWEMIKAGASGDEGESA